MKSSRLMLMWVAVFCLVPRMCLAISVDEAEAIARRAVGGTANLRKDGYQSWATRDSTPIRSYHFEGPASESLSVDVDVDSGTLRRLRWLRLQSANRARRLTQAQALAIAKTFLAVRAHIALIPNFVLEQQVFLDHGSAGQAYSFRWVKQIDEILYPTSIHVDVGAVHGDITGFLFVEHQLTDPPRTPAIPKERVLQMASPFVQLEPGWTAGNIRLTISDARSEPKLLWRLQASGKKRTSFDPLFGQSEYPAQAEVFLDAMTGVRVSASSGAVVGGKLRLVQPPAPRPARLTAADFWPSYHRSAVESVLFYDWQELYREHFKVSRGDTKGVICLTQANQVLPLLRCPSRPNHPECAPDGHRIAFEVWLNGPVCILDLQQGTLNRLNDWRRALREMPSWSPNSKYLCMAGTRPPGEKPAENILVAEIVQRLSATTINAQWFVDSLPGKDAFPVFSPDSKMVAFVHSDDSDARIALFVAPATRPTGAPERAVKIVDLPAPPERISWFPDGRRLLVGFHSDTQDSRYENPAVVDAQTHSLISLRMATMHDPDLPLGLALRPLEPVLSPDGTRLLFSALRWDGVVTSGGAYCIYTSKLDGGDLKRVTRPDGQRMEPYKFPQPGVTALNAWEKLQVR